MLRIVLSLCASLLLSATALDGRARDQNAIVLATTTSTQDSGLLDVLVPRFEKETGTEVKVIAVGTGAALRMASTGNADVVLVHAPDAEKKYVDAGDLIEGRRVMHNDFVIVGPEDDPAGVRKATTAADAMKAIASGASFISRGDDSGTHKQELVLWAAAGIDPKSLTKREETGQGMGATLNVADQRRAYTLTDRGTYLAQRKRLALAVVFEGDPTLQNIYHVYLVNPDKHENIRTAGARAFAAFLVSPAIQQVIGDFKRQEYGQPLFFPDAVRRPNEADGNNTTARRHDGTTTHWKAQGRG
jgi:tungstate transport system substrate-binding protein